MKNRNHNIIPGLQQEYVVLDATDSYTCSFTEFIPFCSELYYFSNFKVFKEISLH